MLGELDVNASTLGSLAVLLLSVAIHEAAHAYVADRRGDPTARSLGRVTLNPLPHLHPIVSVLLPAWLLLTNSPFLFAAGRPVPVVRQNLKSPARDFALVALAGPLTNVLLALLCAAVLVVWSRAGSLPFDSPARDLLNFGQRINLLLAVFNLIPVPPLDGSRLLAYVLPGRVREAFYGLDRLAIPLLLALLLTGAFQRILEHTYLPLHDRWGDVVARWAAA